MVFREVSVIEIREALRAWLAGKSERAVAAQAGGPVVIHQMGTRITLVLVGLLEAFLIKAFDRRGRPQIQGRAQGLSCAVATWVAQAISSGSAKSRLASAWRRRIRHQPSCKLSQQAPLGMKACWVRGWSFSEARVFLLYWTGCR
jgi:hypothetical protein